MVCILGVWEGWNCVKNACLFFSPILGVLWGWFVLVRFSVRWAPKGPTSPNPYFLWCFCFSCEFGFFFVDFALFLVILFLESF